MNALHGLTFVWWWMFFLLPLPLLLRLLLPVAEQGGGALQVPFFARLQTAGRHGSGQNNRLRLLHGLLLSLIWLALVAAVARPTLIGNPIPLPTQGRDVMLAIDLSGSMDERDLASGRLNRLAVVKAAADAFISRRQGDRMGLILFSDRAYLQAPLTFDRQVVRELLREAQVGLTGQKTAIGDAIAVALKRLRSAPSSPSDSANSDAIADDSRVLILLTDGANTAGVMPPLQAAELAKKLGIKIYTIGVGSRQSGILMRGNQPDEATLQAIADTTGGRYFRATDAKTLDGVYQAIDRLVPAEHDAITVYPEKALFHYPATVAALLAALLALWLLLPTLITRQRHV